MPRVGWTIRFWRPELSQDPGSEGASSSGVGRVWIDAQLPPVMARWLREEHQIDAYHVSDLGLLKATDPTIFMSARNEQPPIVVITKDDDFLHLLSQHGPPPQVVWTRCGNVSNAELRRITLEAWPDVARYLTAGEPLLEVRARSGV
jgi:predicted nuclease of predicted toxin-antitoxin system